MNDATPRDPQGSASTAGVPGAVAPGGEVSADLAGLSREELAARYSALQSKLGEQGRELGDAKKRAEDSALLLMALSSGAGASEPSPAAATPGEPPKTVEQLLEEGRTVDAIRAAQQPLQAELRRLNGIATAYALEKAFPDAEEVLPTMLDLVKANPRLEGTDPRVLYMAAKYLRQQGAPAAATPPTASSPSSSPPKTETPTASRVTADQSSVERYREAIRRGGDFAGTGVLRDRIGHLLPKF